WLCVQALGPQVLAAELDFTHGVMLESAKNYQLWNHRRLCALQLGPSGATREEEFTREAITFDEKNYHAWAHRQAIVKMSGRWEAELEFAAEMIKRDVRNNTAWNQRMFVLQHMPRPAGDDAAWLRSELEYVAAAIQLAPRNEAPWAYLTGLFATLPPWASQPRALSRFPEVHTICAEALLDCPACAPAHDVLAAYYE
ncbi:Protein farnesyltransferase/geranylgeranyltransferase type-1 subunit alpha, partial [Tetrabaena socialis]